MKVGLPSRVHEDDFTKYFVAQRSFGFPRLLIDYAWLDLTLAKNADDKRCSSERCREILTLLKSLPTREGFPTGKASDELTVAEALKIHARRRRALEGSAMWRIPGKDGQVMDVQLYGVAK